MLNIARVSILLPALALGGALLAPPVAAQDHDGSPMLEQLQQRLEAMQAQIEGLQAQLNEMRGQASQPGQTPMQGMGPMQGQMPMMPMQGQMPMAPMQGMGPMQGQMTMMPMQGQMPMAPMQGMGPMPMMCGPMPMMCGPMPMQGMGSMMGQMPMMNMGQMPMMGMMGMMQQPGPAGDHGHAGGPAAEGLRGSVERMHRGMDVALSGDADRDFATLMIAHHQGAIDMARIELERGKDAELRKLAEQVIEAQTREIETLRAWLAKPAE